MWQGQWHCSLPMLAQGIAPAPPIPKLLHIPQDQSCVQPHPTPKPSCSCCAGTTQSQEAAAGPGGWCRLPWALRPLSDRARLSPAENMTSAGASARGETFLSCVPGSWTGLGGWRAPCVQLCPQSSASGAG